MRVVRWTSGQGIEHLVVDVADGALRASSVVIGEAGRAPFGLSYRVATDGAGAVAAFAVEDAGGHSLQLRADGRGGWHDGEGRALSDLAGCIDVDLSATPFTNALPIRRLGLSRGERRTIRVVYVDVPSMRFTAVEQAYTCLVPMKRYRYEGLSTGFKAEFDVDGDGLVVDYPGLFARVR